MQSEQGATVRHPNGSLTSTGLEPELRARYGVLMSTEEVAFNLKLRSASALRMARKRGQLQLVPIEIPGRRGQFYQTAAVALLLTRWLQQNPEEMDMT
jgi:hypothetical protein